MSVAGCVKEVVSDGEGAESGEVKVERATRMVLEKEMRAVSAAGVSKVMMVRGNLHVECLHDTPPGQLATKNIRVVNNNTSAISTQCQLVSADRICD